MSAIVTNSIINLRSSIAAAMNNLGARIDSKLDAVLNFEAGASGLVSSDLNAAILEIKGMIDALNTVYSTDAEVAANIQAVNTAWAAADTDLTALVGTKLDVSTYNTDKTATDIVIAGKLDTAVYEVDKATFLTVNDIIDCGVL